MFFAKSKPWSLAARLTVGFAAAATMLILVATGVLYWSLSEHFNEEQDEILADKARVLTALVAERSSDDRAWRHEFEWEWGVSGRSRVAMRVLDGQGRLLIETPGFADVLPAGHFPPPDAGAGVVRGLNGVSFRARSAGAMTSGGEQRVLQLALDRAEDDRMLREFRTVLWVVLAAAPLASAVVGFWVAHRGLRPVAEMRESTARVNASTLADRMPTAHLPAELADLGLTFNAMLDRLEDAFARVTRFSADIAHELRTPIQVLRSEAEVALTRARTSEEYRDVLGSSLEECSRLGKLIDTLLFLARADNPETHLAREPLELAAELEATRAYYEPIAHEAGIALHVDSAPGIRAELDRTLVQRALGNLVANALAHTPSGGRVTLRAAQDTAGTWVEVEDTGHGIPAEHLPFIFDRFYRADTARTMTAAGHVGLGLALVKSIAALHGGSVEATSTVGKGTCIRIRFSTSNAQSAPHR